MMKNKESEIIYMKSINNVEKRTARETNSVGSSPQVRSGSKHSSVC
jgi:hypothetical protein